MCTNPSGWVDSSQLHDATRNKPNQTDTMTQQIKFGFRKDNQKRGKIITGITIQQYLKNLGSEDECITPNGGWFRIGTITTLFSVTIY
jgi:hypothetical protein